MLSSTVLNRYIIPRRDLDFNVSMMYCISQSQCIILFLTDGNCHVCFGEVSGAHKCITCHRAVHVFCGVGIGEEGYGQSVKCCKCHDRGNYYF